MAETDKPRQRGVVVSLCVYKKVSAPVCFRPLGWVGGLQLGVFN